MKRIFLLFMLNQLNVNLSPTYLKQWLFKWIVSTKFWLCIDLVLVSFKIYRNVLFVYIKHCLNYVLVYHWQCLYSIHNKYIQYTYTHTYPYYQNIWTMLLMMIHDISPSTVKLCKLLKIQLLYTVYRCAKTNVTWHKWWILLGL